MPAVDLKEGQQTFCQIHRVWDFCRDSNGVVIQPNVPKHLSPRLEQVVGLIVQGKSNTEIAQELNLSEGTVKEHIQRIFAKLNLHNRTAVAIWSIERNR